MLVGGHAPCRRLLSALSVSLTSGKHGAGDISNRGARKLLLQSLDRRRRGLAQNRKDMSADRAGCARRRPVLGEELAALQRGEDIAQSDVARRPRQFEAASPDRAERGSIPQPSSARRGGEPRPDWCWRYPPRPPNAGPCPDWRRAPSANERQRQIGCLFPSLTLRLALRRPCKGCAAERRSAVPPTARHAGRPTERNLLRTGRQSRPPARLRLRNRRLDSNRGRRLTKRRRGRGRPAAGGARHGRRRRRRRA